MSQRTGTWTSDLGLAIAGGSELLRVTMVSRVHGDGMAAEAAPSFASATGSKRRARGWAVVAILLLPGAGMAILDLATRHDQIVAWPPGTTLAYVGTLVLGTVMWAGLVQAAAARNAWPARVLVVTAAALAVGAQLYFFGRYHAYLNPRAVLVGTAMLPSVGQQLWGDHAGFLGALLPPIAAAVALPLLRRRVLPVSPRAAWMGLDVALAAILGAAFLIDVPGGGEQAAAPDVLYLTSMGLLASARWRHDGQVERAHPGPRTPRPVPPITAGPARRSLLFIVTESVRATEACSVPSPDCATTPYTNALLPDRFGFSQMRALDSTTAVSLAVLWSGLAPTESREALHSAPLLWEYAHAAGFDTAYWTSQNMFFANSGTWLAGLPLTRWVSATDLDPDPTYEVGADDGALIDVVLRDLPAMKRPFVGVVHLSNTHFPYVIDDADAPFQPQSRAFGAGDATKVRNRYADAIRRQDAIVARLVREMRLAPGGNDVVVAFVSDHGEQIRERGAIGHTWGVYDEEVRVPFWIDAPPGALDGAAVAELRSLQDVPLSELDVLPTMLDLMGIWDAPEVATHRGAMPGESLLRGGTAGRPFVLTNCSPIFACAFKNWGAMRASRKLVATQNDTAWHCFDVERDPHEEVDLGLRGCGDLRALAEAEGRGRPF
jgi:hypothetical protein